MEKSIYAAPVGLDALAAEDMDAPLEIEIVDPEEVTIRADGMEIVIGADDAENIPFDANLVDYLDPGYIQTMVSELSADIDNDKHSRKDWEQTYIDGIKLLGLLVPIPTFPLVSIRIRSPTPFRAKASASLKYR